MPKKDQPLDKNQGSVCLNGVENVGEISADGSERIGENEDSNGDQKEPADENNHPHVALHLLEGRKEQVECKRGHQKWDSQTQRIGGQEDNPCGHVLRSAGIDEDCRKD